MVSNFVCQALMHSLSGQVLWHARHHQATEMPAESLPAIQPGVLVPNRVRAYGTPCLVSISVMLELHVMVCTMLDDGYESYANLQLVRPSLLPCMLCSLRLHHVRCDTPHVDGVVNRHLCCHHILDAPTHFARPSPATSHRAALLSLLHTIWVSPCYTADSSQQSSRSSSILPYAASRCPSSTYIHQQALGHSHLPHRALMQDFKHDGSDSQQPAQHHARSDRHSGQDIGWKLYCTASFTTALSMVMAELAKQVEVQCSERAHALALTWNLYSAAMDTCQGMGSGYTAALCIVY